VTDRKLADDVAVRVDEARLARQWSAIGARLDGKSKRPAWVLAPAIAVVLAVLTLLVVRPWARSSVPGTELNAQTIALPDGSHVTIAAGTDLGVRAASRERVELALEDGTVDCDVTHVEGRSFVVHAAGHDVSVLGTQFRVRVARRVDGSRELGVEVRRGRVRVAGRSGEHVLDAGQSWTAQVEADEAPTAIDTATTTAPPPTTVSDTATPTAPPTATETAPNDARVEPGPKELLARATEARSAGRTRDAATALDALRKRYRSDARAGLAAYELGRIRLDALGDPAGAAEAFGDAIALAPTAPFREDAEARRVDAFDAAGDSGRCRDARAKYLARYPSGLHTKQIEQRCGGR
jgi:hypothetical protein